MRVDQSHDQGGGQFCGPDDTLSQAARLMRERDCGFVPITAGIESRRVVGIVTDRDVCMAA